MSRRVRRQLVEDRHRRCLRQAMWKSKNGLASIWAGTRGPPPSSSRRVDSANMFTAGVRGAGYPGPAAAEAAERRRVRSCSTSKSSRNPACGRGPEGGAAAVGPDPGPAQPASPTRAPTPMLPPPWAPQPPGSHPTPGSVARPSPERAGGGGQGGAELTHAPLRISGPDPCRKRGGVGWAGFSQESHLRNTPPHTPQLSGPDLTGRGGGGGGWVGFVVQTLPQERWLCEGLPWRLPRGMPHLTKPSKWGGARFGTLLPTPAHQAQPHVCLTG